MKILFIQPNRELPLGASSIHTEHSTLPLGLLCLASSIRDRHDVRILDCLMHKNTRIFRKGKTLYHGLDWKHIRKQIEDFNPDVLGLTILFTAQESAADKILAKINQRFPKIKIVLGGSAISLNLEKYLKNENAFAIVGEGEESLPLLLLYFQNPDTRLQGIPNLAYRKGGKILKNPVKPVQDLDTLRLPSYDLIDMEKYLGKGRRSIPMLTSRDCPFRCIFCSVRSLGRKLRAHSADYIFRHIKSLAERYRINHIRFEDDCFALDTKRLRAMLGFLENIQVEWEANLGPVSDSLDKRILLRMKKSGCVKLSFALESGNDKVRNRVLGKELDMQKIENLLEACKEIGIRTSAFYITGFPFETKKQAAETLRLARRLEKAYRTEPIVSCIQQY